MNSSKKKLLCFIGAASLGIGFVAFQMSSGSNGTNKKVVAGETDYTLTFSSSSNKLTTTTTEATLTAQTSAGNAIAFAYNNTATRLGYWGKFDAGGYFYNTTAVSGLKSIAITFADTNGVKISYGWSSSLYRTTDVALAATAAGGTATYAFGDEAPSFFKIAYDSAISSVKNIVLTYSCVATTDPNIPGTDGLSMTLSTDGKYYAVTGYTGTSTVVKINPSYKHLPVKEIALQSFQSKKITSISIPSSVTLIGNDAFSWCASLASVSIPSSVTSIGSSAFFGCTSLASVSIPTSVTSIGNDAFSYCTSLASVSIPTSVTSIGNDAFSYCTSLASVSIPSSVTSIGSSAFSDCTSLASVSIPSSVTSIGSSAFSDCTSLASVSIPSSVTSIGSYAFSWCTSLASVSIPTSVISIAGDAFAGDKNLSSIEIDQDNAYFATDGKIIYNKDKTSLLSYPTASGNYQIPSNIKSIGSYAFSGCASLASVSIPSSITSIGSSAFFGCTSLASVSIPSSVTSIGSSAFSYCTSLASVSIPTSVTSIGNDAFSWCTSLASVSIPTSVTSIGSYAFSWCTSLASVSIPSSVTSIGSSAFSDCTSLASVSIPTSVTSIGSGAFSGCTSLASASIPSSVTSIESYAFSDCSKLSIRCQSASQPSNWNSSWNPDNRPVTWGASDRGTETDGSFGNIIAWDMTKTLTYTGTSENVDVPTILLGSNITQIPSTFLSNNTTMTYLRIPDSVTTIATNSVSGCTSLKTLILGSGITSIGTGAFTNCTALEACYYKGTPAQWAALNFTTFGDKVAFYSETTPDNNHIYWHYDTDGLTPVLSKPITTTADGLTLTLDWSTKREVLTSATISGTSADIPSTINGTSVEEISANLLSGNTTITYLRLPDSVSVIGASAFANCTSLTSIIIGLGVTSIGTGAFANCTALEACYYKGTPEQWAALNFTTFGDSVAYYSEADKSGVTEHYYWHYDTDGVTPVIWNA